MVDNIFSSMSCVEDFFCNNTYNLLFSLHVHVHVPIQYNSYPMHNIFGDTMWCSEITILAYSMSLLRDFSP